MNDFDRNYAAILEIVRPEAGARFAFVKSPELTQLRAYAEANLERLVSLLLLPALAAQLGGHEQVLAHAAATQAGVDPKALYCTAEQRQAVFDNLGKLREKARKGEFHFYYQCEGDREEAVIKWYGNLLSESDPLLQKGTDVVFAAAIILAYTLVESLSDDLWVTAVNVRPHSLAANVLRLRANKADDEQKPVIELTELLDFDFDLRQKMGDLLKRTKRVSLDSIRAVERAYNEAFWNPESPDKRKPCVALGAIFDEYRKELFAIEHIRNILVHQGGKLDEEFVKSMKGYEGFGELTAGAKLLLNGAGVARYVNCALNFSKALLSFVDGWLVKYPK